MRPDRIQPPHDEAAETGRAAEFERKQKWQTLLDNRYSPEGLKHLAENFDPFTID